MRLSGNVGRGSERAEDVGVAVGLVVGFEVVAMGSRGSAPEPTRKTREARRILQTNTK